MKAVRFAAAVLFVLIFPAVLFTGTIAGLANTRQFYERGFQKYGVAATTGLAESELSKAAAGLISYFNSGDEYINLTVMKNGQPFTLFNEREVSHLKDVKALYRLDIRVLAGGLIYILGFTAVCIRKRVWTGLARAGLARAGLGGSAWAMVVMLAMAIGSLLNFQELFLQFHFMSFANQLWMLDPSRDYLIMLFPEGFFFDFVLTMGGVSIAIALAVGITSWRYLRKNRYKLPASADSQAIKPE